MASQPHLPPHDDTSPPRSAKRERLRLVYGPTASLSEIVRTTRASSDADANRAARTPENKLPASGDDDSNRPRSAPITRARDPRKVATDRENHRASEKQPAADKPRASAPKRDSSSDVPVPTNTKQSDSDARIDLDASVDSTEQSGGAAKAVIQRASDSKRSKMKSAGGAKSAEAAASAAGKSHAKAARGSQIGHLAHQASRRRAIRNRASAAREAIIAAVHDDHPAADQHEPLTDSSLAHDVPSTAADPGDSAAESRRSAKQRRIKLRVARRRRRPLSFLKQFMRSEQVRRRGMFGWGTAAYLHIVALILLSGFFLYAPRREPPVILSATFSDYDREVPDAVTIVPEEAPVVEEQPPEVIPDPVPEPEPEPVVEPVEAAAPPPAIEPIAAAASEQPAEAPAEVTGEQPAESSTASAEGTQADAPADSRGADVAAEHAKVPTPPHAVTSGNFTAWTEPPLPLPGQPYRIVIMVRLPLRVKEYPSDDLTGVVVGSDGYRKIIRGSPYEMLPIDHHTARIEIPVVGSERGYKDTIMVQSKILRERRNLELTYPRFQKLPVPVFGS
ncbi:MAG: hypothetical protein KDA47_03755 [Planctomycetales bacterium]|nr:hypothetical protein [Planctomycetales bacterium]